MKPKNIIEPGYEPESDFCGDCESIEQNINGFYCDTTSFGSLLHVEDYDSDTGKHQLARCTECKDSEQAAKQMMTLEDIVGIIDQIRANSSECLKRVTFVNNGKVQREEYDRSVSYHNVTLDICKSFEARLKEQDEPKTNCNTLESRINF